MLRWGIGEGKGGLVAGFGGVSVPPVLRTALFKAEGHFLGATE